MLKFLNNFFHTTKSDTTKLIKRNKQKFKISDQRLQELAKRLEKTRRTVIRISTKKAKNLSLFTSKFGGYPFWPKNLEYPKTPDGSPLILIAQFNLNELPQNDLLPNSGILQFFIADSDHDWGIKLGGTILNINTGLFKVVYHPNINLSKNSLITDFNFVHKDPDFPLQNEFTLNFTLDTELISIDDYRFRNTIQEEEVYKRIVEEYDDNLLKKLNLTAHFYVSHKIGGYLYYTQNDPRADQDLFTDFKEPFELLFQMDSDANANIIWGDLGVANFFIQPTDLKNLNFKNVLFNWDCF